MTFANPFAPTFPRIFAASPLIASAGGWWVVTGKTCVAAYQPKAAADLAASYVNLANPGTYNAAPGSAPLWDATNGWKFDGSTYLTTGVVMSTNTAYTVLLQFTDYSTLDGNPFGFYGNAETKRLQLVPKNGSNQANFGNGSLLSVDGQGFTAGNIGLAGTTAYKNGTGIGTISSGAAHSDDVYIGQLNVLDSPNYGAAVYVQALVIYSDTLTAGEVATVSAAMAAL